MIQSLPDSAFAVLLIGVILFEAVVLYAGYGLVERVLGPPIVQLLQRTD